MNDIVLAPAARQIKLLRAGQISRGRNWPRHTSRQIERLNPEINAFADFLTLNGCGSIMRGTLMRSVNRSALCMVCR